MKKTIPHVRCLPLLKRSFLNFCLVMKMTLALILFTAFQVLAGDGNAQGITLQMKKAEIPKVLKAIEKQTNFRFLYNFDLPTLQKKVDVDVVNKPVANVLNDILEGSGLVHRLVNGELYVIFPSDLNTEKSSRKLTGKVSSETGLPIEGASVRLKGTNYGTTTDAKGGFSIDVTENAILIISSIGYEDQEVSIGSNDNLNIVLKAVEKQLDQVVVVGYGTQKKKDLTGSVSVLGSKEMENRPNTQFGYAIEGKAAGVQVIRSSGQPQAGFSIRIRGTSSITSASDPLYIIDGVPTSSTNDIPPSDIESITILKDASSAAIYGSSGSNGVVLITTKRGRNQKMKLSFNTSLGLSKAWKKMDVLNGTQFKDLAIEMGATTDWSKYNKNTNWQDEVFRNALTQNYQLSATGGTKKTTYYISGSSINQNGIVLNNNLKRATIKANLDHQLLSFLKVGTSLAYDNWNDVDVSENNRNGVITRLYTSIPNIGIRDADDLTMYARSPFINDLENPVSTVYQPDHVFKNNRYHGNVYAEADPLKGLKLKSLLGFEQSNGTYNSFLDGVQTRYGKSMGGIVDYNVFKYKYWVLENTVNYNTKIKDHSISALGGLIVSRETTDNIYKSAHDFTTASNHNVESGAVRSPAIPYFAQKSHVSMIGRVNYAYKDKYYVTSNFRADGSGQFSSQHRWGYFPSFSSGWRISQEKFFRNVKGVDEFKLRAGWGIVGNDRADPYAWYGLIDTLGKYIIGNQMVTAYKPRTFENSDLRWEKTAQIDIGIDLTILNNRLSFTADYYNKKTTDMLLNVPVVNSTGFSSALQNAGSLENKGFEFSVSSKNIIKNNFRWTTDFNISFNKNKVLSIVGNTIPAGPINPAGDDFNTAIVKEGMPLGSFYGKISQGVDPATGDIKYMKNLDGADSVGIIGFANPKYIFGLTNTFTYKSFSLNVFFQGVQGNQILNATRVLTESMALVMNQSAAVLRRWSKPGDITDVPRSTPDSWANANPSTRFLENGSFVRLKALTLGYNLPLSAISKLKMSRCMVYFTGENLLTFTKYSGFDPEVSAFSGNGQSAKNQNIAPGVDFGTYPQSRDFILGVNISF